LQEKHKLKQALEFFEGCSNGKLMFIVNQRAFDAVLGANAPADVYQEEVSMPIARDILPIGTALRLILSQVGDGSTTYLIREDHIEIVPEDYTKASSLIRQPIEASFHGRSLREVLQALSNLTALTINVDQRMGDKAETPISASFRNATLEDALVTVTESADLKFVVLNKSVFVTMPSHTKAIEEEEKKRDEQRRAKLPVGDKKK
jgi:hypothetical protein